MGRENQLCTLGIDLFILEVMNEFTQQCGMQAAIYSGHKSKSDVLVVVFVVWVLVLGWLGCFT